MYRYLIIFLFMFNISAADFHLQERILARSYYLESAPLIFDNDQIKNTSMFKKNLISLDTQRNKRANLLINRLAPVLPSEFLKPIIHWRLIEPDRNKLNRTLSFIMLYKANILRDHLQSPDLSESVKKSAENLFKKTYHHKFSKGQPLHLTLIKDFEQKSNFITNFENTENFITAITETTPLSINFKKHSEINPYSLNFGGYIPGNKITFFNNGPTTKERIETLVEQDNYLKSNGEHIALSNDPVFKETKKLIEKAKESIVINMDRISGTIGASFYKALKEKTTRELKRNPHFKTIILTNSIYKESLNAERNSSFIILNSPTQSPVNHTRAIIIDSNSSSPMALIGSKNWSDHQGGYFHDNDLLVEGPGAAFIQHTIQGDIANALSDPKNRVSSTIQSEVLNFIKIKRESYPIIGKQSIRISETDSSQKLRTTRNFIIDMIKKAQTNIYMEQQYLYDSYIINSLIKRKLEVPTLDIRILADHSESIALGGLPNTIYLRELKLYGIEVKSRINVTYKQYQTMNHRNTISVDGKVLLTGSNTISPKAMQGDTRELSIQIYDSSAIKSFDSNFLISWNNRNQVMDLDIQNFRAKIKNETLSKEISSLINAVAASFLKAKDKLQNDF
ncbi:phospholipase D-like domain-containing protein [Halobacteriovorax marinus]|uniref:phospholipase D-like domain-containing protein n=1 Tax=Halobacteriovorax marinus TaxID=97084 RepID=UPI003A8C9212